LNLRIMAALLPTLTRWFSCTSSPHCLDKRCGMIKNKLR
jgi:hypothetical protein